jgi:hypothetical protein
VAGFGRTILGCNAERIMNVLRNGAEAAPWNREYVAQATPIIERGRLSIFFGVPEGKGRSHYRTEIETADFKDLVEAMLRANPEEAIKSFATALKDGIPSQDYEWQPPEKKENPSVAA